MVFNEKLPQHFSAALFQNVHYNLPGLFQFSDLLYIFLDAVRRKFSYDIPVSYIYGSPLCKWNGGRVIMNIHKRLSHEEIKEELFRANEYGITPLLTFSNLSIDEALLEDKLCNDILEILRQTGGDIIVASPLLEQYIRKYYPEIKIHASVIKTVFAPRTSEYYAQLSEKYYYYVVHPDDNYNSELLRSIPTHNAEILVNEHCFHKCKQRAGHYNSISREQISIANKAFQYENFLECCSAIPECKQLYSSRRNISCSIADIQDLLKLGFSYIKIQGRIDNIYSAFFDIMRYTLENDIAFPSLYPIFCSQIEKYYNR